MRRGRTLAIAVFVFALSGVSAAAAQPGPGEQDATARARELFTEALELADGGDWERAVHRFRSALEYHDAATIRFNLASSLSRLGRLIEALEELDLVEADQEAGADLHGSAASLRGEIEPRLGRLTVVITGNSEGTHVTVDGDPWEFVGEATRADPGIRVVRLFRGGEELASQEADLPDGGQSRVSLVAPSGSLATGVHPSEVILEASSGEDEGNDDGLIWGLTIGALLLAVGGGVLIGFLVVDQSDQMHSMGDFMPPVIPVD